MELESINRRIDSIEKELKESQEKSSRSRQEIYERLRALETESGRTDERYKSIMKELEEQKNQLSSIMKRLEELSQKPAKRYETAITTAISAFVGAVIGFFMNN